MSRAHALGIAALAITSSCGGAADYPGKADVVSAQTKWCKALADATGKGDGWEPMEECKDARATGSAAYISGMSQCVPARMEASPDATVASMLQDCQATVSVDLPLEDDAGNAVLDARCERSVRCEEIPKQDCMDALTTMEAAQRATFTTFYNAAAQADIADCLRSSGCGDDEEEARSECYAPHVDKLLWFPD